MIYVNPIYGLVRTLFLLATGRVRFSAAEVGRGIVMPDGRTYRIFRRVVIRRLFGALAPPKGLFIVRFTPTMPIAKNIRLSRIMLLVFMGFRGFRSKYWCVNESTGECMGLYEWDTIEDATRYSRSIAVANMTKRSKPGSIAFEIVENTASNRGWQIVDVGERETEVFKARYKLA